MVRFYVDDMLYETRTPADIPGKQWVYNHDFYLIYNVAVGGMFPGNPDDSIFPRTMTSSTTCACIRLTEQPQSPLRTPRRTPLRTTEKIRRAGLMVTRHVAPRPSLRRRGATERQIPKHGAQE